MWTCPIACFFFSSQSCIALGVVDELRELVYFRGWVCAGFYVLLGTSEGSVCTNGARNLRAKLQEQQGSANKMSPLLTQHLGDTGTESLWGWDQFGLQSEFQTSLGYRVRPCIKNTNNNKKVMEVTAATVLISPWFSGCDVELCWIQSGNSFHFLLLKYMFTSHCPALISGHLCQDAVFSCPHKPEDLLDKEIRCPLVLNKRASAEQGSPCTDMEHGVGGSGIG